MELSTHLGELEARGRTPHRGREVVEGMKTAVFCDRVTQLERRPQAVG